VFNALELENKGEDVFDAVIDKGTLDSLLCGEGSHINVEKMLVGISKCVNLLLLTIIKMIYLLLLF
jgi:hypothetical protein